MKITEPVGRVVKTTDGFGGRVFFLGEARPWSDGGCWSSRTDTLEGAPDFCWGRRS